MQTTCAIILDTRREKQDGTYPVKLRVTFTIYTATKKKYVQRYYPTPFSLTKDDWDKVDNNKARSEEHREIKRELNALLFRAEQVVKDNEFLTPDTFESKFRNHGRWRTVNDVFDAVIAHLDKEGRCGSADAYRCSIASLKAYAGKDVILFGEITVEWLEEYEQWMLDEGRSLASVGIYLRALRSIYNKAIKDDVIKRELYPFGTDKYVIPSGAAFKRALTESQKNLLLNYDCGNDEEARWAFSMWLFSYLCWGINFKDIAHLRYSKVTEDTITIIREKTKNTKRSRTPLVIPLCDQAREIIRKYGRKSLDPNEYVFPILDSRASQRTQHYQKKHALRDVNKKLREIGEKIGLPFKLTTYTARHTFATILKDKGINPRMIQEMLDHQSVTTTENYFATTITEEKRSVHTLLLPTAKTA